MAAECLAAIHLCRIRATRLDATGAVAAGPNNSYVSDKPIQVAVTPVIEAGQDKTLIGGCDCIIATYRGYDKLKRFDFEIDLGTLEPGLIEMLTGATIVTDTGSPIGVMWSEQAFNCSGTVQPNIALEAWQDGWATDHQDPTWPYIHWVWPSTYWQIGAHTLANDFAQPKLTGFSRGNSVWNLGPYGDTTHAAQPLGGWYYSTTIPAAACGYKTVAAT